DLRKAQVSTSTVSGGYEVALEFTDEGAKKFEAITERNVGKPVAIFLDQDMVSSPVVREKISGGRAVISGDFTVEQAKTLSIQLNAGALPVPIQIVEQDNVEATLGSQTVQKGAMAGLVGLFLVVAFMAAYYGKLGLIADLSLIIYGILTLAIYKFVPITLSMPGVAGFILSIGMAVDSNILIFERMKEEMRVGKPWDISMELGFGRAWDSIRDANIATIITSLILFNPFEWTFLNTSGPVRGFAITLLLGVLISLFTGIVVTRTLLRVLYRPSVKKGVAK
ncbi:MAG TPA: protein translocase subunit SecD, partial [Patescibacteria group bacterium]|nr:protein translocase subunit SecD [Patescibacteria group bacterium]